MSASISLVGRSETETLINQLKWLNGWSKKILRGIRMLYSVIETIRNKHHCFGNVSNCDKTYLVTLLDEIVVLLDGPATEMRHNFDLHHVGCDDGELPIHISIEKAMEELDKQCSGEVPVPVMEQMEWTPNKKPIPSVSSTFSSYIKQIWGLSAKVQEILNELDFGKENATGSKDNSVKPNRPHFIINMTVVDNYGHPIKIEGGFDIDKFVNEYNEKRMQEAEAKALLSGKEINGEVQPATPH